MSSEYRILCVSHDPAIVIETGLNDDRADTVEKARRGLAEHRSCDLLVGRYSYPLIEVCCPGRHSGRHEDPIWVEASLLRVVVLALKYAFTDAPMQDALERLPSCWSGHRLHPLGDELGVKPS